MKKNGFLVVALYIVGFYFTQVIYILGAGTVNYMFKGNIPYPYLFQVCLQCFIFAVVWGYIYLFRKYLLSYALEGKAEFNTIRCEKKMGFINILVGTASGLAAGLLVLSVRYLGGSVENITFNNFPKNFVIIVFSLVSTGLAAVMEEIVFRGTLFPMLKEFKRSFLFSSVITGIFFSLFHIGQGIGLIDLLFYFLLSVLLCSIIEKTNTIWLGAGIHLGWNIISKGINIFNVDYKEDQIMLLFEKTISILAVVIAILVFKVLNKKKNKKAELAV